MSNELQKTVLDRFFEFYKNDIEGEIVDASNVVLSFPVHFSGFHRVEVTITQVNPNLYIISDGAKTIDELRMAGYKLTGKLRRRLEIISKAASIRVVKDHLVTESNLDHLGSLVQRFVEAAKTIGDAYLVQRVHLPRDAELVNMVADFLAAREVPYQRKRQLRGKLENHTVDFYFPPNGVPGLALSIMGNPTRMAAEAWAFKSFDIKQTNERTRVGVVYDDQDAGKSSKSILNGIADVAIPGSDIPALQSSLQSIGILKG